MTKWKAMTLAALGSATLLATLPVHAQTYRDREEWRQREITREEVRREERREEWRREHARQEWLCRNRGICQGYYGSYRAPPPRAYRAPGLNFELNVPND